MIAVKEFFGKTKNWHHAYLLVGKPDLILLELEKEIKEKLKVEELSACPDYWSERFSAFGIKDSLVLRERQARRSFNDRGRFFVLTIDTITSEAQNALLKTFEEPANDVHFFAIVRSADIFLPTLKSRFQIVPIKMDEQNKDSLGRVKKFLKMEPQERLDFVHQEFTKSKEINKSGIFDFLAELEEELHHDIKLNKITASQIFMLNEIAKARKYLSSPRSSARLILEHLALVIDTK